MFLDKSQVEILKQAQEKIENVKNQVSNNKRTRINSFLTEELNNICHNIEELINLY